MLLDQLQNESTTSPPRAIIGNQFSRPWLRHFPHYYLWAEKSGTPSKKFCRYGTGNWTHVTLGNCRSSGLGALGRENGRHRGTWRMAADMFGVWMMHRVCFRRCETQPLHYCSHLFCRHPWEVCFFFFSDFRVMDPVQFSSV